MSGVASILASDRGRKIEELAEIGTRLAERAAELAELLCKPADAVDHDHLLRERARTWRALRKWYEAIEGL